MDAVLKSPFPYPGGKSRIADYVWSRIGDVDNYVEPFAGSLATLLRRPAGHFKSGYRIETVNDLNHYVVNFWRAVRSEPEKVAEHADWPVTEADLHARHNWLVRSKEATDWAERMRTDPDAFDAKIAGWWVWGCCCWIGGGWCGGAFSDQVPELAGGRGVTSTGKQSPKIPLLSQGRGSGVGIHGGRPQLADAFDVGRGVNSGGSVGSSKIPMLSVACDDSARDTEHGSKRPGLVSGGKGIDLAFPTADKCTARREWLVDWMRRLADRLRIVRTCYGHWSRICDSESTLTRLGTAGVFLDPPYPIKSENGRLSRDDGLYATDSGSDLDGLRDEVLDWCRRWGCHPEIRVALCCYEGDGYEPLAGEGWSVHSWEASGGYGNQRKSGKGKSVNAKRERIYFSPACIETRDLLSFVEDAA